MHNSHLRFYWFVRVKKVTVNCIHQGPRERLNRLGVVLSFLIGMCLDHRLLLKLGLLMSIFVKKVKHGKKMLAEDAEEAMGNRTNLHTVSIMERVEIIQEMCGSLLKLPAEVQSLKGRVHKLESVIHV